MTDTRPRRHTLSNGLRVLCQPLRSAGVVAVAVHYGVGFRSEPVERAGFAHLFEHLMFQGSANVEPGGHFATVQACGGAANGATLQDHTEFYQVVPVESLDRVLLLEADRMAGPRLGVETLRTQVLVVKEEIRQNVLGRAFGGFPWTRLPSALYTRYENAHNGYGTLVDIDAAQLGEFDDFFRTYYTPGNAVVTICGDVEPDRALALAESRFGGIPARTAPPAPELHEPIATQPRRLVHDDPHARAGATALGYRLPDVATDLTGYLAHHVLGRHHDPGARVEAATGRLDLGRLGVLDLGADGSAVVCAVAPVNLSLRSPREQDAVVAGFARWLHSLSGPVQIVTRTQPLDLSGQVDHLYRQASQLRSNALAGAAHGHAAHLAAMAEHTELLHHEFLIVFRDRTPALRSGPRERRGRRDAAPDRRGVAAAEALRRRVGDAAALLGPLGLRVTALQAAQARHVLHRATAPGPSADDQTRPDPSHTTADAWDDPSLAEAATVELPLVAPDGAEHGASFDPGPVVVAARQVGRGGVWSATLVVTGYPREASSAGWLTPLTGHPGLVDVSLHITPVEATVAAGQLRRQLARLESARRATSTHDRLPDPDVDAAAADAHLLAERVARGETKLFATTLTVTVTAPTPAELDAELAAIRGVLASLLITAHPTTGRAWHAFKTGLPLGIDLIGTGRILDSTALAAAFPFASPDLPPPEPASGGGQVLFGHNLASSSLVFWDRWAGDNYNSVVLGRSGSGKSYLTKLELLRSLYGGVHAHVIDPEDEYVRLADAVGATVVRVGAPGVRINPLDLDIHTDPAGRRTAAPDALARRRMSLHSFLALALTTSGSSPAAGRELSASERAILDAAITTTYLRAGITDDPATWTRPAPQLRDLHTVLTEPPAPATATPVSAPPADPEYVPGRISRALNPTDSGAGVDPGDLDDIAIEEEAAAAERHGHGDTATSLRRDAQSAGLAADLAQRLRPYVDGAFSDLFDGPTTSLATGHLVVWSLRELPEQQRSLATMLVLDTIWRTVTHPHDRRRRLVVVDEAWLLLQHPAGAQFLLRAAKSGRKHWCGLTVATQDTTDVLASDLGRAVVTNSATQILLRQAPQAIEQVARVFGLSAGERALLLTAERGEGLLTGGEHRAGFAALASPDEDQLITTDPAQLTPSTGDSWIDLDQPAPRPMTPAPWAVQW